MALALPVSAPAAENAAATAPFDLAGYLNRALEANPGIEALRREHDAAQRRVPQAGALPDPTLQVTAFVESVQTRTGPQEQVIALNQRVPWFGTLQRREAIASASAAARWHAYQAAQLELVWKVAQAYYEYGYTGEALRLTRESRDLLRKLEPVVEAKVEGGGPLNALLRLKVELGRTADRVASLSRERAVQSSELRALLALEGEDPLPFPEWSAPEPLDFGRAGLVEAIRAHHPALRMLEATAASAEARREVARLQRYPDLTFGLNYIRIGDPSVNPRTPDAGQDPWGFTIALNLPIWSGKYDAAEAEALAERRASESDYADRLNHLKAELSGSLATLEDAHRRLELYGDELLDLARQAVENSRAGYEGGQTGLLEVIDSERSLLELQMLYWRAAADAWKARVTIQSLTNQPISKTLRAKTPNEN